VPAFLELPTGPDVPHVINAVIEIPRGSTNKYEYDKEWDIFRLDRTLYSPVHYPGDYGFIPRTHAEDGDPLDVIVVIEETSFPGCVMEVRPVGVLIMRDDMGLDHKILAVPMSDPRMRDVHGLQHLPSHYLKEIDYFFNIYKELEGKKGDTYGWEDRVEAFKVIEDCVERYKDLKAGYIDRWGDLTAKGKRRLNALKRHAEDTRRKSSARLTAVEKSPPKEDAKGSGPGGEGSGKGGRKRGSR